MPGVSKGAAGEVLAARFLRTKGYRILTSNYRSRFGEIDIIAVDEPYIAFVEVKTRSEGAIYAPREAVTIMKQQKIMKTAACFLAANTLEVQAFQPRFDVIEIVTKKGKPMDVLEIDHLMNAYEAGDLHASF